jgi:hypothetical protein
MKNNQNNSSRRQIIDQMETRFKTIMIGSIARFEKEFGALWNNNNEPTNDQEVYFGDKWEDLRQDLLDHGNNQIRQGLEELNMYLNSVEKYRLQVFYNQNRRPNNE